jgi:hypothetical protein
MMWPLVMQEFGFEPHTVELRIAFGTKEAAWTNHRSCRGEGKQLQLLMLRLQQYLYALHLLRSCHANTLSIHNPLLMIAYGGPLPCSDSELVRRLQPEIERFGRVLKWIHRLEPIFVFVPIKKVGPLFLQPLMSIAY